MFALLDDLLQNHEHSQLQVLIKMTGHLLRQQSQQEIEHYFSILYPNFFKVSFDLMRVI